MSKQSKIDKNIEAVRTRHEREEKQRQAAEQERIAALKIKNATAREKWEKGTPSQRAAIRADVLKHNRENPHKPAYEPHKLIDRETLAAAARETGGRVLDRASDAMEDFDPEVPVRNHIQQIKSMSRQQLQQAGRDFGSGQSGRMVVIGSRQPRTYAAPRPQARPLDNPMFFLQGSFGTGSTFGRAGSDVTQPLDRMSNWLLGSRKRSR
jgi:hypothetical protein